MKSTTAWTRAEMQGYSIAGYLNAVMRRTEKTILVEGITDQSVLKRLKNERSAAAGEDLPGIIDVAGLLTDDDIAGLGKKEVVKTVLDRLSKSPKMAGTAVQKLGTLMDREWDDLLIDMELQNPWFAPIQGRQNFITVGHSVENYFFGLSPINAFLKQFFSDYLDQNFFNALSLRFNSIIGFAVVYSLALRDAGAIGRAQRVIDRNMIEWHDGHYIATPFLNRGLASRGVQAKQNLYLLINAGVKTYLARYTTSEPGRWLCHGHLGEQAIWSCVAHLANEMGIATDVSIQIERGLSDVRFRHCVDYLCRHDGPMHAPLDSAVDWLTT